MRSTIAIFTTALVGLTSGCGTVCNLASDRPFVYGGVARSVTTGEQACAAVRSSSPACYCFGVVTIAGLTGADVCASAVGDTLTYPFLYSFRRPPKLPQPSDGGDSLLNLQHAAQAYPAPPVLQCPDAEPPPTYTFVRLGPPIPSKGADSGENASAGPYRPATQQFSPPPPGPPDGGK
jgi:uncharacterized protein YceK